MKKLLHIIVIVFLFKCEFFYAQLSVSKAGNKISINLNEGKKFNKQFDTLIGINTNSQICLACLKVVAPSTNKFIKINTTTYQCNYINANGETLKIKTNTGDTTRDFNLSKNSLNELQEFKNKFVVTYKANKYLINNQFKQLTFGTYNAIKPTSFNNRIIVEVKSESGIYTTGLVSENENWLIEAKYSDVKCNPNDSLFFTCSSGIVANGDDDVYNFEGKKIAAYKRHIDFVNNVYVIHKIFIPTEYYIIYNSKSRQEKIVNALSVKFLKEDDFLIQEKKNTFLLNFITDKKEIYTN